MIELTEEQSQELSVPEPVAFDPETRGGRRRCVSIRKQRKAPDQA